MSSGKKWDTKASHAAVQRTSKEGKLITHFKRMNPKVLFLLLNTGGRDDVAEMKRKDIAMTRDKRKTKKNTDLFGREAQAGGVYC